MTKFADERRVLDAVDQAKVESRFPVEFLRCRMLCFFCFRARSLQSRSGVPRGFRSGVEKFALFVWKFQRRRQIEPRRPEGNGFLKLMIIDSAAAAESRLDKLTNC